MGFNVTALAQKARTKTIIVDSDLDMGQYDVIATDVKGDTAEFSEFVGGVGNFAGVIFQGDEPTGYAPIGCIIAYAGNNIPNGWLSCDGSAISRTTYEALFNAISNIYGNGDGSSTFNLPNLNGKVIIGVSSSHILASTGGEETHVLTIDEMPSHNHSANAWLSDSGGSTFARRATSSTVGTLYTNNTGGGQAHNNMQPYITLNYIIRAI